jgi:hypothetical protein
MFRDCRACHWHYVNKSGCNWNADRYNEATDKVAPRLIPTQDQRDNVTNVLLLVVVVVVVVVVVAVVVVAAAVVVVVVVGLLTPCQVKLALHSMTVGDDEPMSFVPPSLYVPYNGNRFCVIISHGMFPSDTRTFLETVQLLRCAMRLWL